MALKTKSKTRKHARPRSSAPVKPSAATHEPWPKFKTVSGKMVNGVELVKTIAEGCIPALVRPGMMTFEHSTGNGEAALIVEVQPDHAVVKTENGKLLTMGWHEMQIIDCAPDPAYVSVREVPLPSDVDREYREYGTAPIGWIGIKRDGSFLSKSHLWLKGDSNESEMCYISKSRSEIFALAFDADEPEGSFDVVPVYRAPQHEQIVGYAVMWDGAALGANSNQGDVNDISIVDVGRTFQDACKIVAGSELTGSGKLEIVPLGAGAAIK